MGERRARAPAGLRASTFVVDRRPVLVLSYPAECAAPIAALTAAEAAVLRAAVFGSTNVEIAKLRKRSVFTIQNQLACAFRKLGVTTRAEAAMLLADVLG
jgi:DNA-binding NarL/FixJ family response regulator